MYSPLPGYKSEQGGFGFALMGLILSGSACTGCFYSNIRMPDFKDVAETDLGLTHSPHSTDLKSKDKQITSGPMSDVSNAFL